MRQLLIGVIRRRRGKPTFINDVTAALVRINKMVSDDRRTWSASGEPTVSEHCIVTSLASPRDGAAESFRGWAEGRQLPVTQHMAAGHDVTGIMEAIGPTIAQHLNKMLDQIKKGETVDQSVDTKALNELLRQHDFKPTDKLS